MPSIGQYRLGLLMITIVNNNANTSLVISISIPQYYAYWSSFHFIITGFIIIWSLNTMPLNIMPANINTTTRLIFLHYANVVNINNRCRHWLSITITGSVTSLSSSRYWYCYWLLMPTDFIDQESHSLSLHLASSILIMSFTDFLLLILIIYYAIIIYH